MKWEFNRVNDGEERKSWLKIDSMIRPLIEKRGESWNPSSSISLVPSRPIPSQFIPSLLWPLSTLSHLSFPCDTSHLEQWSVTLRLSFFCFSSSFIDRSLLSLLAWETEKREISWMGLWCSIEKNGEAITTRQPFIDRDGLIVNGWLWECGMYTERSWDQWTELD